MYMLISFGWKSLDEILACNSIKGRYFYCSLKLHVQTCFHQQNIIVQRPSYQLKNSKFDGIVFNLRWGFIVKHFILNIAYCKGK